MDMRESATTHQSEEHNLGRQQAREMFLTGRNERGWDHEKTMHALLMRTMEMARALNVSGTSLQGFLRDTARLHGFADQVGDLRFQTQDNPTEEDILRF